MAEQFTELNDKHIEFIGNQKLFFVGTAGCEGLVNVSPKGMDSFRVIDRSRIAWLNHTGSGNETAAHVLENKRMTILFNSFDKQPLILRLYGNAELVHQRDDKWDELIKLFPEYVGVRQLFELDIVLVQTSCGYGVPYYEYKGERNTLKTWADNKGKTGIERYWEQKNTHSLDGKETRVLK